MKSPWWQLARPPIVEYETLADACAVRPPARFCDNVGRVGTGGLVMLDDAAITNALSQTVEKIRAGDLEQAQASLDSSSTPCLRKLSLFNRLRF